MSRARKQDPHDSFPAQFAEIRADYQASKQTRWRSARAGIPSMGSNADFHLRNESEWLRIIELARSFDRDDAVLGQGVSRLVDNVFRAGIVYDPKTDNDKANEYLRGRWAGWAEDPESCDRGGEETLHSKAMMAFRHMIVDGDHLVLPTSRGSIESVEAHRLRTPSNTRKRVVLGILLDRHGRRHQYWFTKDDVGTKLHFPHVSDVHKVPARDKQGHKQVFHVRNPKRSSQTRGVSAFAPIADFVGMHDDIQFANLVRAQISACFTIFREREPNATGGQPPGVGSESTETLNDGSTRTVEDISPGMEITGEPGEKLHGFAPNTPPPAFFDHTKMILGVIAVNLGLPLQVLLLDATETNFSGWRGAIDQARIGMAAQQRLMIERFYRPILKWKIRRWLGKDTKLQGYANALAVETGLPADVAITQHVWRPPAWAYIEPTKDARAEQIIIENHLDSRRALLAKRGLDIDEVDARAILDRKNLIAAGIVAAGELNASAPESEVTWRDMLGEKPVPQQPKEDANAKKV